MSREVAIKTDRNSFSRMIILAKSRPLLDLREVLYSLGLVPWSLANLDGSLMKTSKSKLLAALEKDIQLVESIPNDATYVVDGMALLQSITTTPRTFAYLAFQVFKMCRRSQSHPVLVDFVGDRYSKLSIKPFERQTQCKMIVLF